MSEQPEKLPPAVFNKDVPHESELNAALVQAQWYEKTLGRDGFMSVKIETVKRFVEEIRRLRRVIDG